MSSLCGSGFDVPDPGRMGGADEDPLEPEDAPEFAQDFVGEDR